MCSYVFYSFRNKEKTRYVAPMKKAYRRYALKLSIAFAKLRANLGEFHALGFQKHGNVIEKIRRFRDRAFLALVLRRDYELDRFFTHFLADSVHATRKQEARIRPALGILFILRNDTL